MCSNCKQHFGFDEGFGCSANMVVCADRYVRLKREILRRASSVNVDLHVQAMLREIVAEADNNIK